MRVVIRGWLLLGCFILSSACSIGSRQEPVAISTSDANANPITIASPSGTEVSPILTLGQYLLLRVPQCDGLQILEQPIKFAWPNIEDRIKEIGGAMWGYYGCGQPQGDIAAFYRENTPDPPYNLEEVNWVERNEGDVGVYYNAAAGAWIYVWIVPQPDDQSRTFVIVAETLEPIKGGC